MGLDRIVMRQTTTSNDLAVTIILFIFYSLGGASSTFTERVVAALGRSHVLAVLNVVLLLLIAPIADW
jgi:hypothetical protein